MCCVKKLSVVKRNPRSCTLRKYRIYLLNKKHLCLIFNKISEFHEKIRIKTHSVLCLCVFLSGSRIDPYLGTSEDELKLGGALVFLGGRSRSSISCFATFVLRNIRSTFPCIIPSPIFKHRNKPPSNSRMIPSWGSQWSRLFWCKVNVRMRLGDSFHEYYSSLIKQNICVFVALEWRRRRQIQSCDCPNKCPAGEDKTIPG